MAVPRYILLGCKFDHPLDKFASLYASKFRGIGKYPADQHQQNMRQDDIRYALAVAVLKHLGSSATSAERFVNGGFDVALDYFFGNWWRVTTPHVDYQTMLDKEHVNRDLVWFQAFSNGLLLGLLTQRWSDLETLCSWPDPSLKPEYLGGKVEDEVCQLYISIAAALRSTPMEGLTELESNIRNAKAKRPRLLFKAWEAGRALDQPAFDKAMKESLTHFDAKYQSATHVTDWIAQHQSTVCLAAMHLGLDFPKLPERLAAMLMTRESIEIAC